MLTRTKEPRVDKACRVKVWDVPVRLFHWILVSCFITAWLTLDNRYLDIHVFAGYVMGGLIVFRILWGIVGDSYARFRDFAFGWREAWNYMTMVLKRWPTRYLGHNPAGSWAIYLLLGLGLLITITGLLGMGGEERQGPLAGLLNYPQGESVIYLHEVLSWVMLGTVAVHLTGVATESILHRENLVGSMITGYKKAAQGTISAPPRRLVGTLMLVVIVAAGFSWFYGYLIETPEQPYRPFTGRQLPDNALWREECGACHLAFHPSLLPVRSWKAMMEDQSSHFDEDLFLEQEAIDKIETFLAENAAEQALTEAAWKINRNIPKTETPLRITETQYWIDKHKQISDEIWRDPKVNDNVNCAACHLDAEAGTFEDAAMRIPAGAGKSSTGIIKGIYEKITCIFSFNSSPSSIFTNKS